MASPVDADYISDLFSAFGPVSVRRMFGGAGIFADGLMIGLIAGDAIYLKADDEGATAFAREGCEPFRYATRDGERTLASYWRMPDRLYDDPDALAQWARDALGAARKSAQKSTPATRPVRPRAAKSDIRKKRVAKPKRRRSS